MNPLQRLKLRLRTFAETRLGVRRHRRVRATVLGRRYEVVAGTVGRRDYGDAWLAALAREARVVFDVGSNVGQAALMMLAWNTIEEIVLVEANPDALAVAAENLVLNGLIDRARLVRAFAADADGGEVRFYTVGTGARGACTRASPTSPPRSASRRWSPPSLSIRCRGGTDSSPTW